MRRDVFQAISDPVRRRIVDLLAESPLTVNEVAAQFEVSRPAISRHLRILEECGVLRFEQQGRSRICSVEVDRLIPAFMWLEKYRQLWEARLDQFGDYLEHLQSQSNSDPS